MSSRAACVPVAILAAGEGRRLARGESDVPKPCRPLLGRSLAEWSLGSFVEAGLDEFVIAVGYRGEEVRHHYQQVAQRFDCRIDFVTVTDWRRGNGMSALAAARSFGGTPFLLAMADHLFSQSLIGSVVARPPSTGTVHLAVDPQPGHLVDVDDLTKVRLEGDRIVAIGKELDPWDAGDTGLFYCTGALAEGLERAQAERRCSLSDGVGVCASEDALRAIVLHSGQRWMDIDTPADFAAAERRGTIWIEGSGE